MSRIKAANFAGILFFQNMRNLHIDTLVLGEFLSDFVQVKSNVSPKLFTSTY